MPADKKEDWLLWMKIFLSGILAVCHLQDSGSGFKEEKDFAEIQQISSIHVPTVNRVIANVMSESGRGTQRVASYQESTPEQGSLFGECIFWIALIIAIPLFLFWVFDQIHHEVVLIEQSNLQTATSEVNAATVLRAEAAPPEDEMPVAAPPVPLRPSTESSGELETRASLERIFHRNFSKIRPAFLVNPETGRRLELDCFNEQIRLAVEYSGAQHFAFPNAFHKSQAEFEAQQRRDYYKEQMCLRERIILIIVPFTVKRCEIEAFLRTAISAYPALTKFHMF